MSADLTNGARWLKRGDSFDPEDFRMTNRLRVARGILRSLGIEAAVEHCDRCKAEMSNVLSANRGMCWNDCKTTWPEWATNEIFNAAFELACRVQNERGSYNRREAERLHLAREAATA